MEPIISPWIFYLISILHNLSCICVLISLFAGFAFLISLLEDDFIFSQEQKTKVRKRSIIILLVSLVFAIVIPTKQISYNMLIAHYATQDNVVKIIQEVSSMINNK